MPKKKDTPRHTIEELYALPEGERAELIDGEIYDIATPLRVHQRIVSKLVSVIDHYIESSDGDCEVYPAPFAVILHETDESNENDPGDTYVEPDVSVICDPGKLSDRGCEGVPDWVIEVVSKSSIERDYFLKLMKYWEGGVRSYWIIDPAKRIVRVYDFMNEADTKDYSFEEMVPVAIYPGFGIRIADFV